MSELARFDPADLQRVSRLLGGNQLAGKAAQRALLLGAARSLRKGLQTKIKHGTPVKSGRLKRSMKVAVSDAGGRSRLHVKGATGMIAVNKRQRFVSKPLRKFGDELASEMEKELARWIRRNAR
ncbi:MAG: hypothetical protein F4X35_00885 [Alphaproteobacteria bacterium]|nr:hypothetical protein [Alphaproteobacteria bacterium]